LAIALGALMALPAASFASGAGAGASGASSPLPGGAPGVTGLANSYAAGSYNWPELHGNAQLTGVAENTSLSTHTASQLGVKWAAEMYGQAVDSPSVAYNSELGETLVYIGTEPGYLMALNLENGQVVWSNWLGSPVVSSPVYNDGSIYVGTQRNSALFNVNATTGNVVCTTPIPSVIEGTAVVATPPGGVRTVYISSEDTAISGPTFAINADTCAVEWTFTDYHVVAGPWDPNSYVVAANGTPLVLTGTSDPDESVYAIDALTGKLEWRYQTVAPAGDWDVAAGITISAPGVNGFPDGVAYCANKYGALAALNLSDGKPIWAYNYDNLTGSAPPVRATAALDGINLVYGHEGGMFDLNAKNGSIIWQYADPSHTEIISSPAIAGRTLDTSIVVAGDIGGSIDVVALTTGKQLYTYQTGGYITASPAISYDNILIDSTDGLLYKLAVGGSNDAHLPTTSVSFPTFDSSVANPSPQNLTIFGNASDLRGVAEVGVGIETGGAGGPWWDSANGTWTPGPYTNPATLTSPGATSTAWTFSIAVPAGGQSYSLEANAISIGGQTDLTGASTSFSVAASRTAAHGFANPSFVGPGGTTIVNGSAFGADERVTISYLGQTLATERTTSSGYLRDVPVRIPTNAGFGLNGLTLTGERTGKVATVPIEVLNSWDSEGYNATHTGAEIYDSTFYDLIELSNKTYIHLAWNFVTGAPINASPVESNNVVYVANTAGVVYAVSAHNGGIYWTWNGSGGSPLESDALAPSLDLLFVTAQNGDLYAISTVNATTQWTAKVGGNLTAPEVTASGVYVASTTGSTGLVELLAATTGVVVWSDALSTPISASPAISNSGTLLAIGTWGGVLYALNATTGASEWNYSAGGQIRAAAIVWDGKVYFGSTNGNVDALTTGGAFVWTFKAGAGVEDTGAITSTPRALVPGSSSASLLMIGTNDGITYGVHLSDGKRSFSQSGTGAVVSVAEVLGMVIDLHANGEMDGVRNYADYSLFSIEFGAYFDSTPVIVNGAIFVTSGTGALYAYTGTGADPA
jgi:outer membrane protein assembly factor BamB